MVDLDSLVSLSTTCKGIPEAKLIFKTIKEGKYKEAAELATIHHKKFNRLIFHNLAGLTLTVIVFIYSTSTQNRFLLLSSGGILTHLIFDLLDDIKQLDHIKNWLWIFGQRTITHK